MMTIFLKEKLVLYIKICICIYNFIKTKNIIPYRRHKLINIDKDGNRFYKSVSYLLYGTIEYHSEVRNTISNQYEANLEELCAFRRKSWIKKRQIYNDKRLRLYDIRRWKLGNKYRHLRSCLYLQY